MDNRILRRADIEKLTGFKWRHLHDMEARGCFPKRFHPDPNSKIVGWLYSEVMAWIAERAASREAA